MNLIDKIFQTEILKNNPPVLVDVGASGNIHKSWAKFAKYAICLAFDADDRQFAYISDESKGFKKLYIFNSILSGSDSESTDFYLTQSPYCSSTLLPDSEALEEWAFAEKFKVKEKISLKNVSLNRVLDDLKLSKIDWLKTDSQGIDLSIFKSLPEKTQKQTLVVELEPGLMDSYKGEDKLHEVFAYFERLPFWLGAMTVKGSQRLQSRLVERLNLPQKMRNFVYYSHKSAPGWAELKYFNDFSDPAGELTKREYLLGWVFAVLDGQFGYSMVIALKGEKLFNDAIFKEMFRYSQQRLKREVFKLKFLPAVKEKFLKLFSQ